MGFLASTVRLLAAILKPVMLGFQNIVTFRFYPWVILRQNFCKIGSLEGLLRGYFWNERPRKIRDIKFFILLKVVGIRKSISLDPRKVIYFGLSSISRGLISEHDD